MASRRLKAAGPPAPERQKLPLPDELLEDIFRRLSSPVDLVRVSASCFSFGQIIAKPHFLRQYRAVHPPLLLGCFLSDLFHPAVAPHPNATAARALAGPANVFYIDYLPHGIWRYSDVCEGRMLLQCSRMGVGYPDLAVCDLLHRQYRLLPPVPDDLIASTQVEKHSCRLVDFKASLVPSGNLEDISFKVITRMQCKKKLVIFLFSSESNLWSAGASTSWIDLGLSSQVDFILERTQYESGCFYWEMVCRNTMLKLDINRMELSSIDLPPDHTGRQVVIAEAGEGRLAIFSHIIYDTTVHYFTIMQNEWQMEKAIPLPFQCELVGASAGYIFLLEFKEEQHRMNSALYSLEMKTFKIERVCLTKFLYVHAKPYFGFPPFLSPRRI